MREVLLQLLREVRLPLLQPTAKRMTYSKYQKNTSRVSQELLLCRELLIAANCGPEPQTPPNRLMWTIHRGRPSNSGRGGFRSM